jgi:hypothetical protein
VLPVDEEQALWEVATALGVTFDADAPRTRAHAAAALLALLPEPEVAPLDREWRDGLAQATIPATVTLLANGVLDDYLKTGENLSGAANAVAKLAPLPEADDIPIAEAVLEKLYARRHTTS